MNDNGLLVKSNEVMICSDEIVALEKSALDQLKKMAEFSPRRRARICAHKDNGAMIQEMVILINRESYVSPHRHINKCESFHLIEGSADIVVFHDNGDIDKVIRFSREHAFYYRLDTSRFHTIVVRSENIIFHETTNGPFVPDTAIQAAFAPAEKSIDVPMYRQKLDIQIKLWLSQNT